MLVCTRLRDYEILQKNQCDRKGGALHSGEWPSENKWELLTEADSFYISKLFTESDSANEFNSYNNFNLIYNYNSFTESNSLY